MNSLSDIFLINRVLIEKDKHAFAQLVRRYQSDVRNLLLKLTNGNRPDTDDMAQETFIQLWNYRDNLNPDKPMANLLFTICMNKSKIH